MRKMAYLKNTQNSILSALGGAPVDNPLCINGVDEALIVEGIDFELGTFELVTRGTYPLNI